MLPRLSRAPHSSAAYLALDSDCINRIPSALLLGRSLGLFTSKNGSSVENNAGLPGELLVSLNPSGYRPAGKAPMAADLYTSPQLGGYFDSSCHVQRESMQWSAACASRSYLTDRCLPVRGSFLARGTVWIRGLKPGSKSFSRLADARPSHQLQALVGLPNRHLAGCNKAWIGNFSTGSVPVKFSPSGRVVSSFDGAKERVKISAGEPKQRRKQHTQVENAVLKGLNEEQRRAVEAPPGPIRVVAGPGSGKTRVLTSRVAHLIAHEGIKPKNIMCITFTNKAASEVKQRLEALLGAECLQGLSVGTFHATAARILRSSIGALPECGLNGDFLIYDDQDCTKLCKVAVEEVTKVKDFKGAPSVLRHLLMLKMARMARLVARQRNMPYGRREEEEEQTAALRKSEEALERALGKGAVPHIWKHYEASMRSCNALDFDDLLILTVELLHKAPSALKYYRNRFTHLLVDEFQDTDEAQYELVRLLACESQNLFVVGDIDQAIYGWRGANPKNMQQSLDRDFSNTMTLQLKVNYRSSRGILEAATVVIRSSEVDRSFGAAPPLTLKPVKPAGLPVAVAYLPSDREEARLVVGTLQQLASQGLRWKDFAVVYRTHSQSRLFEENLARAKIPFVVLGGIPFYSRKEVKDMLAYLRLISNPMDEIALERIINVPPRSIGATTWSKVKEWARSIGLPIGAALQEFGLELPPKSQLAITPRARAAVERFCALMAEFRELSQTDTVGDLLIKMTQRLGYKEYLEKLTARGDNKTGGKWLRIEELVGMALETGRDYGPGREGLLSFLEDLALVSSSEREEGGDTRAGQLKADAVKLMTIHASKGLEYNTVFLTGLEEGLLPASWGEAAVEEIAEERRLCYVAMTRAEERLYLTHCQMRYRYGKPSWQQVSRFLEDVHPWYHKLPRDEAGSQDGDGTELRPSLRWYPVSLKDQET